MPQVRIPTPLRPHAGGSDRCEASGATVVPGMVDSHSHHRHGHAEVNYGRAFAIGIAANLAYLGGEAVAGIFSGSLALLADAGHNLGDVLGLALSWGAAVLGRRQPSGRLPQSCKRQER